MTKPKAEKNKACHSRGMLSGIYNACRCKIGKDALLNGYVEAPRYRHSGMTPNLMGFTLIELLVVVLIIGILAAVAVPQYQKAVWKTRALQANIDLRNLINAIDAYYLDTGAYPWPEETATLHGLNNKEILDKLAFNFPDRIYNYLVTTGSSREIIYIALGGKYPDFSLFVWLAPGAGTQYRKVACGATNDFGEQVCQSICGSLSNSVNLGELKKGCFLQ